ncbi:MAG: metal-dependent hydrolase [Hydrogenibacillus sp.]|nr:metal-dependent hydrolase [Hydrogenibacillus sp.]
MDSGTHFIMGLGLFALAHLDPTVVASTPALVGTATATVIGSQMPDADIITRLGGNAFYLRHHRGLSHALPMLAVHTLGIAGLIAAFGYGPPLLHLLFWTALAVFLHVGTDIFNSYGTQVLRPWRKTRVALHVIPIVDPFIIALHLAGLIAWAGGSPPGPAFLIVYLLLPAYFAAKTVYRRRAERALARLYPHARRLILPKSSPFAWQVVIEAPHHFLIGRYAFGAVRFRQAVIKENADSEALAAARRSRAVQAFLAFSSTVYATTRRTGRGVEVRYFDIRYFGRERHPLMLTVVVDERGAVVYEHLAWKCPERMNRRLGAWAERQTA